MSSFSFSVSARILYKCITVSGCCKFYLARSGKINPWPDGTTFAKLVWKNRTHEKWPTATIPGDFVHVEFMIKDSKKYASTGGWGFARWLGMEQKPYGKDAEFVQECFGCHTPMKDNEYVFTHPAVVP